MSCNGTHSLVISYSAESSLLPTNNVRLEADEPEHRMQSFFWISKTRGGLGSCLAEN